MSDVDAAYKNGELNDFFYNQLSKNLRYMPDYLHGTMLDEAKIMSMVGVDNEEDQKTFLWISTHVRGILQEILLNPGNLLDTSAKVSAILYNDPEKYPIHTLIELFKSTRRAVDTLGLPLKKIAYPQGYGNLQAYRPYNINKWMQATRDIYTRANQYGDLSEAFAAVTNNWDKMETQDYKAWLRFYQENAQNKYKTAQYYENNDAGYILPNPLDYDSLKAKVPHPLVGGGAKKKEEEKQDVNDVRTRIEQQRHRIISRLNSAEKLLSSLDGQFFARDDQEYMLKLLQDLKRKVQIANKLTVKSTLFEDFIYKTANMLRDEGKGKAGRFFYAVAQAQGEELLPMPEEGAGELEPMDMMGGPGAGGSREETLEALKEFFSRLENGVSDFDEGEDVTLRKANDSYAHIIVEAQATQPERLEVNEDEIPQRGRERPGVDDVIDSALRNITVQDVINNLEVLANFYKKREMSRQLSFVDIMMDRLGIGSFFPEMGEAMSKGLEANQYIGTRIDTVLSRLRGIVDHPQTSKILEDKTPPPAETAGLRSALEQEEQRQEARKQRRKDREEAKEMQPSAGEQLAAAPQAKPTRQPAAQPAAQPLR